MTDPDGEPSDRSLLRRARDGQSDASTRLYLRYARRLQSLAAAKTGAELGRVVGPDDIVQSVFRTFFRRASEGQYDVPEGEEIWKLLLVIALNKVRSLGVHYRAKKRDIRRTTDLSAAEAAGVAGHDETAVRVLRSVIDDVLADMQPSHRRIVELRIEAYEVAEIAAQVKRSKRSVERVLQDFRQRLGLLIHEES